MSWRRIGLVVVSAWLVACGTATPYQPASPYGYAEQQLESNRFRVTFAGNSLTDRETVENYLLYRAAELTSAKGYDYFVLTDQSVEAKTRYQFNTFSQFPTYGFYRTYGFYGFADSAFTTTDARPRTRYEAVANIMMFKGAPPQGDIKVFDPQQLLHYLKPTLRLPE